MTNNRYDRVPPPQDGSNRRRNNRSRPYRNSGSDSYRNARSDQYPSDQYPFDPYSRAYDHSRYSRTSNQNSYRASNAPRSRNPQPDAPQTNTPRSSRSAGRPSKRRPTNQTVEQRSQQRNDARGRSAGSTRSGASSSGQWQQNVANERYRQAYQSRTAPSGDRASAYRNYNNYRQAAQRPQKRRISPRRLLIGVAVAAVVVVGAIFGISAYIKSLPITITLNGNETELSGEKNINEAIDALEMTGVILQPGDFVAVDGSVLEPGEGEPFSATINDDETTTDGEYKLSNGDVVELSDGGPIEEEYDATEESIPYETRLEGSGAIHLVEGEGTDGVKTIKTGKISGVTAEETTTEPSDIVLNETQADVSPDKVIALTFDDGPWYNTTEQILDILKEYDVKATFFTVGNCIDEDRTYLVKREFDEGHDVCTHSYDHADGSGQGVNLTFMSAEEQIEEIEKGYDAIEAATGEKPSKIVRFPGGNLDEELIETLRPYITADIGWNIDTLDWSEPGVSSIVEQIESAQPGDILLMHDGGGDRTQTVEALEEALPWLISNGFEFVTISELLEYPME